MIGPEFTYHQESNHSSSVTIAFIVIIGEGLKLLKGEERIPFGPFIVIGALFYMLYGEDIFQWYFNLVLEY